MTNKVQKIREEVEKLKSNLIHGACASQIAMETRCKEEAYNEVLAILDTMQEEPVSVWHYASEEPKENTEIVFQWHSEDSGYKWMDVGFYNKDGNYIKTIGEQGENEIEMKFVTRWAKSEDLLKL